MGGYWGFMDRPSPATRFLQQVELGFHMVIDLHLPQKLVPKKDMYTFLGVENHGKSTGLYGLDMFLGSVGNVF